MKGLLSFMVVMILCASCQYADRQTARSLIKDIETKLSHPPGSVVVLTVDELNSSGSSDTCSGSDKSYFYGSSQSRIDIVDYYDRQLGSDWSKYIDDKFTTWSKLNGRFDQTIRIRFEDTGLDHAPPYISAVIAARMQYSTTYELIIVSFTADTCKGG